MNPIEYGVLFAGGLFVGMLVLFEVGRRIGVRRRADASEKGRAGLSTVEGSVFGLMGLLVAFTFSGAATRFDDRRKFVTEEANDIGTAYLRIDLLPEAKRPALQDLFRQYLDSRIETYRKLPDIAAAKNEMKHSSELQRQIWTYAVTACGESGSQAAHMLLLPALNAMIDITTTRTMLTQLHPPWIIFVMLGVASLASSLLAGYGMSESTSRSWLHIFAFAVTVALTIYIIIDIEYPRLGLFQVRTADNVLLELREGMK